MRKRWWSLLRDRGGLGADSNYKPRANVGDNWEDLNDGSCTLVGVVEGDLQDGRRRIRALGCASARVSLPSAD